MNKQSKAKATVIETRERYTQYNLHGNLEEHQQSEMNNLQRQISDLEKTFRRQKYFYRYFLKRVPGGILRFVTVQMNMWGWDINIQMDLRKSVRDPEKVTILLIDWATKFSNKNKNWKFEKKFNDTSGKFYYKLTRHFRWPGSDYEITINGTANVDDCEIKQVRRMRKVWVTDCSNGEVK